MKKIEQETIIVFNELEESAEIETYSKRLINRLRKLSAQFPDEIRQLSVQDGCARYRIEKELVTVRMPYSEQRKQADRERIQANGFNSSFPDICQG